MSLWFVVESPNKVKIITSLLKELNYKNIKVIPTYGHLRALDKFTVFNDGTYNINWKYNFNAKKFLNSMNSFKQDNDFLFLFTDPDREGEAIAQSVLDILDNKNIKYNRISTCEITLNGIKNAVQTQSLINQNLINAFTARVLTDKLIGYTISPLLWAKLHGCSSAGRVQSVALKIIYDRDKEICNYVPCNIFFLSFLLEKYIFSSKQQFKTLIDAKEYFQNIFKNERIELLANIDTLNYSERPDKPFNTASLQIYANKYLNITIKSLMSICQTLYEGVNLNINGLQQKVSLITYPRTDSNYISNSFVDDIKTYITNTFGDDYFKNSVNYRSKNNNAIQESHECIRPTYIKYTPEYVKKYLNNKFFKVYESIYNRSIAYFMHDANYKKHVINLLDKNNNIIFTCSANQLVQVGFKIIYNYKIDNNFSLNISHLQKICITSEIVEIKEKIDTPPSHISESELVKILSKHNIGRPSTYGYIIDILKKRDYTYITKNKMYIKNTGIVLIKFLEIYFPEIINLEYTKNMENLLESILLMNEEISNIVRKYKSSLNVFSENVKNKKRLEVLALVEKNIILDNKCTCGGTKIIRYIKSCKDFKQMCTRYPDCKFFENLFYTTCKSDL